MKAEAPLTSIARYRKKSQPLTGPLEVSGSLLHNVQVWWVEAQGCGRQAICHQVTQSSCTGDPRASGRPRIAVRDAGTRVVGLSPQQMEGSRATHTPSREAPPLSLQQPCPFYWILMCVHEVRKWVHTLWSHWDTLNPSPSSGAWIDPPFRPSPIEDRKQVLFRTHTDTHVDSAHLSRYTFVHRCVQKLVEDTQSHKTQANICACPDVHGCRILIRPGKRAYIRHRRHSHVNLSVYRDYMRAQILGLLVLCPKMNRKSHAHVYTRLSLQAHTLCAHT